MLDLDQVDLGMLCSALEDHSWSMTWWFDARTGESIPKSEDIPWGELGVDDPEGLIAIEPEPSSEGYRDMEEFIERVSDPRARDLLARAIEGRGAFRRFKDTLYAFGDLQSAWYEFRDARAERRALAWLGARRLVDAERAEAAIEARPDPDSPLLAGEFDGRAVAAQVAADLRNLFGTRLRKVLLFGSWARGNADRDSDIDLLVVLDRIESPWEESERMSEVLGRHSLESDTVVSAIPIAERELETPTHPFLLEARRDAVALT